MIYSYIDTALRVIHFNQDLFDDSNDAALFKKMMSELETARGFRAGMLQQQVNNFQSKEKTQGLIAHEFHHYWQGIFYPFLYYIGWLEFTTYINFRAHLLETESLEAAIQRIKSSESYYENISAMVFPFYLNFVDGNFTIENFPTDKEEIKITLVDLIEEATTLFQYKATSENPTPDGFFAWIQNPRNKSYKKIHKFLVQYLGKEFIYLNFQACVQLAFHTTTPIEVFAILLNTAKKFHTDGSSEMGYYTLKELISDALPETDDDALAYKSYLRLEPLKISDAFLEKLTETATFERGHYPISVHAKKYLNYKKDDDRIALRLLDPSPDNIKFLMTAFHPYAIHYNFTDISGRNSILHVSDEFLDIETSVTGKNYHHMVQDYLALIGSIQSIFTDIHLSTPHFCHHTECSYHQLNFCRKFNTIPLDYNDCYYPDWLAIYFHLKIDIPNKQFIKISEAEVKAAKKRYDSRKERLNKKSRYQFAKLGSIVSLQIPKKIIAEMDPAYPRMLFDYVRGELSLKTEDMFNRFIFEFFEHADEKEPIFEIPEIKAWMQLVKQAVPELFFYIAFDSVSNQQLVFLPFFSKFTKISYETDIRIKFEPDDITECILNEAVPLARFFSEKNLDIEYYTKKLFTNINSRFT